MKIYRLALSQDYANKAREREDLPFDQIFGDQLRFVIPIVNQELLDIVTSLESGQTKSQRKYKVDVPNGIAYRLTGENDEGMDSRPFRLGKVITKELGQEYTDEWSRQVNSLQEEGNSIIISRSPIDVMRMSDHRNWTSCHAPGTSYFQHAIEEGIEGGAIAYVVSNDDLQEFKEKYGEGTLEHRDEIFEDYDRDVEGIQPISRLRINRYVEENSDNEDEIGLPVDSIYPDCARKPLPSGGG